MKCESVSRHFAPGEGLVGAFHLLRSNCKNFGDGSFAALVTIARSDKLINFAHSDLSSIDVLRHTSGIFVNLKIDFVQRTGADGNILEVITNTRRAIIYLRKLINSVLLINVKFKFHLNH